MRRTVILERLLYRYRDAAEALGRSPVCVRNLIEEGKLERIYILRRSPRVTVKSIAQYLQSQGVEVVLMGLAAQAIRQKDEPAE